MISRLNFLKRRVIILCAFFISAISLNASYVLVNDEIINQKVSQKVESLGAELYSKSGVSVFISLPSTLGKKSIQEYENELALTLRKPYVLLTIAKNESKIDIVNSVKLDDKFDKEQVLSPFPWSGTIVPILASKKEKDKYNAAVLNGYADIVEQIAKSYGIKLEGAIGSTNKDIYYYLRIGIYGFLLIIIGRFLYKKVRKKYG